MLTTQLRLVLWLGVFLVTSFTFKTAHAQTIFISDEEEVDRAAVDAQDDEWRAVVQASLAQQGQLCTVFETAALTVTAGTDDVAPIRFVAAGHTITPTLRNMDSTAPNPLLGLPSTNAAYTSGQLTIPTGTPPTLQDNAPMPTAAVTGGFFGYYNDVARGQTNTPNAVLFEFSQPLTTGFGVWFGDLETRADPNDPVDNPIVGGTRAYFRLFDAAGTQIGSDFFIDPEPGTDYALCGGSGTAGVGCGNRTTRWIGFSNPPVPVAAMLLVVGDDDVQGAGSGAEQITACTDPGSSIFQQTCLGGREFISFVAPTLPYQDPTVCPQVDLSLSKQDTRDPTFAGAVITYTLAYSEQTGVAVGGITIVEELPPALTFLNQIHAVPPATLDTSDAAKPTWTVALLPPGQTGLITLTARVTDAFAGLLTNTASISHVLDATSANNRATADTLIARPAIDLEKFTNGPGQPLHNADEPPGPEIVAGSPITWSYILTNTGTYTLTTVTVTDADLDAFALCPRTVLGPAGSPTAAMLCTLTGAARLGLYSNTATVIALAALPDGQSRQVTASDRSHYTGIAAAPIASLEITKSPAEQTIFAGSAAYFTLTVTNTGNVPLTNALILDPRVPDCTGTITELVPGGVLQYACRQENVGADFTNVVTATASATLNGVMQSVTASDQAVVHVVTPAITLQKTTNHVDGDLAPGPFIPVAAAVTWRYVVTNTGNTTLTNVIVTDDQGVSVQCPTTTLLPPPAASHTMVCTAGGSATEGQYVNRATATGIAQIANQLVQVQAQDPSHYFGTRVGLSVTKEPSTQTIVSGTTAIFALIIENTGNVDLSDLVINDPLAADCTRATSLLRAGASLSFACRLEGVTSGLTNTVNATAVAPTGESLAASDAAVVHVVPPVNESPELTMDKRAVSEVITEGATAVFSITVTNIGDVALTDVMVNDPLVPGCDRSLGTLVIDESVTYTCQQDNVMGDFTNLALAQGTSPQGVTVSATGLARVVVQSPPPSPLPSIRLIKSPGEQQIAPGGRALFVLTVINDGNTLLENIVVSDAATPACAQTIAGLQPGESSTVSCRAEDVQSDFVNQASVTAHSSVGTVTSADTASVLLIDTPPGAPALSLHKEPASQQLLPGESATFTITVSNTGNLDLTNVVVEDHVSLDCGRPLGALAVGETIRFTCQSDNVTDDFVNVAIATGSSLGGTAVATDRAAVAVQRSTPVQNAAIGNRVWYDENGNGLQDANEAGVEEVLVRLYDAQGRRVAEMRTDANGDYTFQALPPGEYWLEFLLPAGYVWTEPGLDGGMDGGRDSDVNPATSRTAVTVLQSGEADMSWDAGIYSVPDLSLTKSASAHTVSQSSVIVYTLTYANRGTRSASNVTLIETIPQYTSFAAAASMPGWSCRDGTREGALCTYSVGVVPAGATESVTFAVRVEDISQHGAAVTIQNVASIEGDDNNGRRIELRSDNNRDSASSVLVQPMAISIYDFRATQHTRDIVLRWTIATHSPVYSFNLWRSVSLNRSRAHEIMPTPILASQQDSYQYTDHAPMAETTYYYWLQEIGIDGRIEEYGPLVVYVSNSQTRTHHLPLILR